MDSITIEYRYYDKNEVPITSKMITQPNFWGRYKLKYIKEYPQTKSFFGKSFSSKKMAIRLSSDKQALTKISNAKYVAAGFQAFGNNNNERDYLRVLTSNDGINFRRLGIAYPPQSVRDPDIVHIGNKWFIAYTDGLIWTSNFKNWHRGIWNIDFKTYSSVWAPNFFKDATGWHVAVAMLNRIKQEEGFTIHVFNFDPTTKSIGSETGILKLPEKNAIDPKVLFLNGNYSVWYKGETDKKLYLATSPNLNSNFNSVPTTINDFQINKKLITASNKENNQVGWYFEAPELVKLSADRARLYFDTYDYSSAANSHYHGMYFSNFEYQTKKWTLPAKVKSDFKIRHFSVVKQNN